MNHAKLTHARTHAPLSASIGRMIMRVVDCAKMLFGSGVVVLACSSIQEPHRSVMSGPGGAEAKGGALAALGGVAGIQTHAEGGSSGLGAAGLDMVAGAMAAEGGAANTPKPIAPIKTDCNIQGPTSISLITGDATATYYLFAVASFPGKSADDLLHHAKVMGKYAPTGYLPDYYVSIDPMVKDGSAMFPCGSRRTEADGTHTDVVSYTDITFSYE